MSITYPYPSHVCAATFVTVKLSGRDLYDVWKTQMQCLLKSHDMLGFIDGTFGNPQNSVLGKEKENDYTLWGRSDAVVKGWILGSLSQHALSRIVNHLKANEDFSAKDVWDNVERMYGHPPLHQQEISDLNKKKVMKTREAESSIRNPISEETKSINEEEEKKKDVELEERKKRRKKEDLQRRLYIAILDQDIERVLFFMKTDKIQLTDTITINGDTALHVVVATTKNTKFLTKMLEKGLIDMTQLDVQNSDGSTPLHVAAIVGNIEAAKILVDKNNGLLLAKDNEGQIPLARALFNMHSDLYLYLLDQTKSFDREMHILPIGADELVVNAISSKDFESARKLFDIFRPVDSDAVLMAMAQNFPLLDIWERMAYKVSYYATIRRYDIYIDDKNAYEYRSRIYRIFAKVWPLKFLLMKCDQHIAAFHLLLHICGEFRDFVITSSVYHSFINPIFEATRQNAVEVVQIILRYIPNAIWIENEDGHNIIQHAVVNRSENVYNLLYQMTEQKNIYKTIKDSSRNNLLHLAARLAPPSKLNLISGAALQIQRELQWFEEVKKFVCPLNIIQKNSFEETPKMVFTREHKDLVIEGEKWMKDTAESYTITAALITTIMFAAAITVPGGNNQDSGIPIFTSKTAFKIFAVSDAISLLSSITSLVMFLSILTARFAEQDFLFKLPIKLIIGLATLVISTIAMIIAFGATMFLVFGKSDSSVLVHIAIWSCLPVACFLKFHFPLVADLISATYGPSIFGKKNDRPFY